MYFDHQKIVFDIDGTLISYASVPRYDVIQLLLAFHKLNWKIYAHSGGGVDYAKQWIKKLGLDDIVSVVPKGDTNHEYSIAVDDEPIEINQPIGAYINAKIFIKV